MHNLCTLLFFKIMDTLIKDISHESLNYIPSDPQALFTGFG